MKYQFRTDIETKVPTCALIENYQDLSRAIKTRDWDLVQVAADCLADTIQDYTTVPEGLNIRPSGSSLVLMSEESGIIVGEDGEDIRCIAGAPVSDALCGDCSQCGENCFYKEASCCPEIGRVRLREGEGGVFDTRNPAMSLVLLDKKEEAKPIPLSHEQVHILNLKVRGCTCKEIAWVVNRSEKSVAETLRTIAFRGNQYGFFQLWPEGVEMPFSENEYARAVKLPEEAEGEKGE